MIDNLANVIENKSLIVNRCLIGGAWVEADDGSSIDVDNPSTLRIIGDVPDCGAAETDRAIDAASLALDQWSATSAREREQTFLRWHDLIVENRDDLARVITFEQGKPLTEATAEVDYAASFVRWFAAEVRRVCGDILPAPTEFGRIFVLKQPIGVVGCITPWNFPSAMITRKACPAIAAGCSVVIKPSELTPFSALALAVLAEQAGIPNGVLNIVTGAPDRIGESLTSSNTVRAMSFTGSTSVGKLLYRNCSSTMKRLCLELGGNAPFIVFDDADINDAVSGVMASKFRNGGQTCVCANRIFVHRRIYEEFATTLAARVSRLEVGDGLSSGTHIGPVISEDGVKKIEAHVRDAIDNSGDILTGGNRSSHGQRFFEPTVITNANSKMRLANEETFGPVAPLFLFDDEYSVVEEANDTQYGLAAYVYTRDLERSFRVCEALRVGMVGLNAGLVSTEVAPFGGVKESGIGREGSSHGIDEFLDVKAIHQLSKGAGSGHK